jgi:hypothetical protein
VGNKFGIALEVMAVHICVSEKYIIRYIIRIFGERISSLGEYFSVDFMGRKENFVGSGRTHIKES